MVTLCILDANGVDKQGISDYTAYKAITQIRNALRNKGKSLPTGPPAYRQAGGPDRGRGRQGCNQEGGK